MQLFESMESEVRGYCRAWPAVFDRAEGSELFDEDGRRYLDFFAGAGALNYGHNHPILIDALRDHLTKRRVIHGLDMATTAKRSLLEAFGRLVLEPRSLDYKLQFTGPTGTNAVEAALKLARKVTGRDRVVGFTNAFHGMTLGSLAVTGNAMKRQGAGIGLTFADSVPFDGYLGPEVDTLAVFETLLADHGSGLDLPAAVIVETIQAEGGINAASSAWLLGLQDLCRRFGILLIVDDIQVGCGRTGPFFSFEQIGLEPDIVCLSKSLSGVGLPLALVLLRPDLDVWKPGEHNGTFRGNNAAFVTATAALETFWTDDVLADGTNAKARTLFDGLTSLVGDHEGLLDRVKGAGLIQGVLTAAPEVAGAICRAAFERGLIVETAGPVGEVVKLLPALTVTPAEISEALQLLGDAVDQVEADLDDELTILRDGEAHRLDRIEAGHMRGTG